MAIAFGSDLPSNFKLGSSQVTRILKGDDLVWPIGATGALPLDISGGADQAYSVRLLSSVYTGPCMRVVRSSDGTNKDIGFNVLGNLNTADIIDFVGGGIGTVNIWYDQSGNGFHISGGGIKICESGSIMTSSSGRPALRKEPYPDTGFLRVDASLYPTSLDHAGTFTNIEKYSQAIITVASNENLYYSVSQAGAFLGSFPYTIFTPLVWRYNFKRTTFPFSVTLESETLSLSRAYSFAAIMRANGTSTLYQDGLSVDTSTTGAGIIPSLDPSNLIMGGGASNSGSYFSEYIHYNRDCTSFVADLNANMVEYYNG